AKLLEFEHPQLSCKAGEWSIRQSLIATKMVDLVVGPETMITNASGCFDTPKIVLLSHSSKENLTKYWKNDYSLEPDVENAPCYPCHQLHYSRQSCPSGDLWDDGNDMKLGSAPVCTLAIKPLVLLERLEMVYQKWKEAKT